ncbi:MAG TPA: hypothetical protein VJR50_20155 [Mycobacterium sp.]|jgi:hypothetical protein|nr:hypothetical protein [Mycobacterium sp.]
MDSDCRGCRGDLDHCHGTVILHALQRSECTEADCVMPDIAHAFVVDCDAIGCVCAQPIGSAEDRASSTG